MYHLTSDAIILLSSSAQPLTSSPFALLISLILGPGRPGRRGPLDFHNLAAVLLCGTSPLLIFSGSRGHSNPLNSLVFRFFFGGKGKFLVKNDRRQLCRHRFLLRIEDLDLSDAMVETDDDNIAISDGAIRPRRARVQPDPSLFTGLFCRGAFLEQAPYLQPFIKPHGGMISIAAKRVNEGWF